VVVSRGATSIDSYGDVYYLSDHVGNFGYTPDVERQWTGRSHSAIVVATDGEPRLIVDGPDYRADRVSIDDIVFDLDFPAAVAGALRDLGLDTSRIGVVGMGVISAKTFGQLRDRAAAAEFLECDELIAELRVIKSPFEQQRMRAAAEVGDAVITAIIERAQSPGVTEAQAVAAGYAVGVEAGVAFYDTAVASGPYSNYFTFGHLPSWSARELEQGNLFHFDSYGAIEGYLFDFGRSRVVGSEPTSEQLEVLEGGIVAVEAGIAAVRPGVAAKTIFATVHERLLERGLAPEADADMDTASALALGFECHGHSLGFGWESPWLVDTETSPLRAGMCLAVECMPALPGVGAAFFEQEVLVTEDGCELLTHAPTRYW
jgi:Xaa-Pro aminopeptidase